MTEFLFVDCDLSYANLKDATCFEIGRCDRVIFHETIMPDGEVYNGDFWSYSSPRIQKRLLAK